MPAIQLRWHKSVKAIHLEIVPKKSTMILLRWIDFWHVKVLRMMFFSHCSINFVGVVRKIQLQFAYPQFLEHVITKSVFFSNFNPSSVPHFNEL